MTSKWNPTYQAVSRIGLFLIVAYMHTLNSSERVNHCADLITFSYNRPMQLYAFLESAEKYIQGFRKIAVICRIDPLYQPGYAMVQNRFPYVHFFIQSPESPSTDFKPLLMKLLFDDFGKEAAYVVFAVDDIIITDTIYITNGIDKLQETGAYALYYRLGFHVNYCYMLNCPHIIPHLFDVNDGYFAWYLNQGTGDWAYPNTVDLSLYFKEDLKEPFSQIHFINPSSLEGFWAAFGTKNFVGLCCTRAKMINIPCNIVSEVSSENRNNQSFSTEELNHLFLMGLKIDISPFHQILNVSAHVDYAPTFINRADSEGSK